MSLMTEMWGSSVSVEQLMASETPPESKVGKLTVAWRNVVRGDDQEASSA